MSQPIITALIDTCNHERFIERAITSVMEQSVPQGAVEILLVDDGSTDRTPEIAQKFVPRVRILRKKNGGQGSAFNFAVPEARGQYVALLDGDDWWGTTKLATVLEAFAQHPEAVVIGHGFFHADEEGRSYERIAPESTARLDFTTPENILRFRPMRCFFGSGRVVYRTEVLKQILPMPEDIVIEADEYLWTTALCVGPALVLDQALTFYRMHGGNLYSFRAEDPVRERRKYKSLVSLSNALGERLPALGIPADLTREILASLRVEVAQHRLALDGGSPLEMFRTERAATRLSYSKMSAGYRLFKSCGLALTLMMPPRQFCRLKRWYAARGLRRFRQVLGEPTPVGKLQQRKVAT